MLTVSFLVPVEAMAENGPVPDRVVIDLPGEISSDRVPVGGHYDIYALVYDASGRDITDEAEAEWWISPDIASWTYISTVGMRLFPEAMGVVTINTRAWVGGVNVTTSIDLVIVITVESARLDRLPATGYVYPGDVLDLQLELLDHNGDPISYNTSYDWNATSGTIDRKVDPAYITWTAGPAGTAVITVEYSLMDQSGSASLTVDVLCRLSAIIIDDIPEQKYSGVYFEFHVTILDDRGGDVTAEAIVRPAVWIDGCMTDIDWQWNSSSGYMGIRAAQFGKATVSIRAELNGVTLTVSEDVKILEGISPDEPEVHENPFLDMRADVMIAIIIIIVVTTALLFWTRSRRSALFIGPLRSYWQPDLDDDDDDDAVLSQLDSMLLDQREGDD
jgi:hypothetical protein